LIIYIFSWFVSILFILIKGGIENHTILKSIDVDIVIILIVYLLTLYGETAVGIFAFCQGLVIDIFSGGMLGLFALLYLVVFFCIRIASRPLDISSTGGQMAVISMTVLLKNILMVTFLYLFSMEIVFLFSDLLFFVFSAICSSLIAPLLFYLLNLLNRIYIGADGEI
jgi:rod shape-determining protein MreD